jgi:hypothetical protein
MLPIILPVNICIVLLILNYLKISSDVQFYGENNQFKRSQSGVDQRGSPFKKRQFTQQIALPVHTGLLIYKFSRI